MFHCFLVENVNVCAKKKTPKFLPNEPHVKIALYVINDVILNIFHTNKSFLYFLLFGLIR